LREIIIIPELNNSFFHAKSAKGAKFYFFSGITLALEWSQTSLRQECAKHPLTAHPLTAHRSLFTVHCLIR
jgi:hypothetical protein